MGNHNYEDCILGLSRWTDVKHGRSQSMLISSVIMRAGGACRRCAWVSGFIYYYIYICPSWHSQILS